MQRSGQALLESLLVILITGVVLFGVLQIAVMYTGREILQHAASRGARARSVGFNRWMVEKTVNAAAIPNSGMTLTEELLELQSLPSLGDDPTPGDAFRRAFRRRPRADARARMERELVPLYLAAENRARAGFILNYVEWERGSFAITESPSMFGSGVLRLGVSQQFPLQMPFAPFFFPFVPVDENGERRILIEAEAVAGEHSGLYLAPREL